MNYKNRIFLMFFAALGAAFGSLEAVRISLVDKNDVLMQKLDSEDATLYCFGNDPLEVNNILLAYTFETHPETVCFIGWDAWQEKFTGAEAAQVREQWLQNGLDPLGRKATLVRRFERVECSLHVYRLSKEMRLAGSETLAFANRRYIIRPALRQTALLSMSAQGMGVLRCVPLELTADFFLDRLSDFDKRRASVTPDPMRSSPFGRYTPIDLQNAVWAHSLSPQEARSSESPMEPAAPAGLPEAPAKATDTKSPAAQEDQEASTTSTSRDDQEGATAATSRGGQGAPNGPPGSTNE